MNGTTHAQKVDIIQQIYLEQGMTAINGMYAQLLAQGTDEARLQFDAAAREAGFVQDMTAPDNGYGILSIFGMAWRKSA